MRVIRRIITETNGPFARGDCICLKKGYKATCQLVEPGGAIFVLDQVLDDGKAMNAEPTNQGGWKKSELRTWLHENMSEFLPEEVQRRLVDMDGDLVRVPKVGEIFGDEFADIPPSEECRVEYYDAEEWLLMRNRTNRYVFSVRGGAPRFIWCMDRVENGGYATVTSTGCGYAKADCLGAVRAVFKIY